jgi:DNA-binding MarR family transcriptional regulator/GNAT superfamily N-acetyltransferase
MGAKKSFRQFAASKIRRAKTAVNPTLEASYAASADCRNDKFEDPSLHSLTLSTKLIDMSVAVAQHKISPEMDQAVAAYRRFTRFYTGILGLLGDKLLKGGRSLTEARVLYELGGAGRSGAKEIAAELNLDPGYLSRILRKLERERLLARTVSAADARQVVLRLTRRGKAAFASLDRFSTEQAREALGSLAPEQCASVIHSMGTIESLLSKDSPSPAPVVLRPHRPGDMGWVVSRNGALYAQEYGWDDTYEALVARITADFITHFDPRRERCWIAERAGERLGCIFLVKHPEQEGVAKLRLLLVESSARGMGVGKALVNECIAFARACGYKKMTLWTQSILHAAHHIYQQAGFYLIAEEPHHSFGVDLTGQTWELDL